MTVCGVQSIVLVVMIGFMFDFCPEHHGHEDHSARSQAFGRIALNKIADAFRSIWAFGQEAF